MKTVQYFSDEYLRECSKMSPEEIVEFLEGFRELQGSQHFSGKRRQKSKLISLKVAEDLLAAFREKADREEIAYQTQIKKLMLEWLASANSTR